MLDLKVRVLLALTLGLAWSGTASAVDREEARDRLKVAREQYADMINLKQVYFAKQHLLTLINRGMAARGAADYTVRQLHAEVDGMPGPYRRNNIQQGVYQSWLYARNQLAAIDREVEEYRAQSREVDEAALARAQALGKRPASTSRFDILTVFPDVERQCNEAFDRLRSSVSDAGGPQEVDRLLRELNGDLNRSGEGDNRYGPPGPFLADFRNFKRPSPAPAPTPGRGRNRKLASR